MNLKAKLNPKDAARFYNQINGALVYVDNQMKSDIRHEANIAVNEMKLQVPVDTGKLKREIHVRKQGDDLWIESETKSPSGYMYSAYIEEYGGRFRKGQHYFSNTINKLRDRVLRVIKTGIRSKLTRSGGSTRQRLRERIFTPSK